MTSKKIRVAVLAVVALGAAMGAGQFDLRGLNVPGADKVQKGMDLFGKASDLAGLGTAEGRDKVGQTIALAATDRYHGLDDRDTVQTYVTLVGLAVARAADPEERNGHYTFGVLDSDEPTACSGPGGYVMITRGALNLVSDESELAGVLAHEIAHVVKNHGIDSLRNQKLMGLAESANDKVAAFNAVSDGLVTTVLDRGYSQKQEEEADKAALNYLNRAGYDPQGFVRFLKKLQAAKGNAGGGAFSTHPSTRDRIKAAEKNAKSGGATNVERFAKMMGR